MSVEAAPPGVVRRQQPLTARALALASCPDCQLLIRLPAQGNARCPRCHAAVRSRKPGGLSRSWAFLLAAAILYIPANVFPIMTSTSFGVAESDTIISGMIYLLLDDTWPLGVIVFIASILVPILKIGVLSYLLITVQRRSTTGLRDRAKLYRMIETIGRWSMVDVYVVTIVVALVRLGNLANVRAEPGAVFFGAVVVLTMLAAASFDPRRIWDITLEPAT